MFKKFISIVTVFAVLIAFTPVVAADTAPTTPTVESILNDYHEKVFAAQVSSDTDATAYSSRSVGATLTLEQETVNELTAAGYDAYNVTGDNYDIVGEELNTDLASLGITDDGSYIVVISGEDSASESGSGRAIVPQPGDGGGGTNSPFVYSYEGVNYTMRYVTVTADVSNLKIRSTVDLLAGTGDSAETIAQYSLSAIGYAANAGFLGNLLLSMISEAINISDSINTTSDDSFYFSGKTNWTVVYTQIYDNGIGKWSTCASVEYATALYEFQYHFFNPVDNEWDKIVTDDCLLGKIYSEYYNDTNWRKEYAVLSYNASINYCEQDIVEYVAYKVNGVEKIRHWRGNENFETIPGLNS